MRGSLLPGLRTSELGIEFVAEFSHHRRDGHFLIVRIQDNQFVLVGKARLFPVSPDPESPPAFVRIHEIQRARCQVIVNAGIRILVFRIGQADDIGDIIVGDIPVIISDIRLERRHGRDGGRDLGPGQLGHRADDGDRKSVV